MCGIQSEITHNTFSLKNNTEVLEGRDFENLQYISSSLYRYLCLVVLNIEERFLAFKEVWQEMTSINYVRKVAYEIKYWLNTLISLLHHQLQYYLLKSKQDEENRTKLQLLHLKKCVQIKVG